MERIPNWLRWTLIALATLILCSCRASLDVSTRPLPSGLAQRPTSREDIKALRDSIKMAAPSTDQPRDAVRLLQQARRNSFPSAELNEIAAEQLPPVVRPSETGIELLDVQSEQGAINPIHNQFRPADSPKAPIVSAAQRDKVKNNQDLAASGVYLHIEDEEVIPAGAQFEAESPSVTDTVSDLTPLGSETSSAPGLAPIVDSHSDAEAAGTIAQYHPTEPILDGSSMAQPYEPAAPLLQEQPYFDPAPILDPAPQNLPIIDDAPISPPEPSSGTPILDAPIYGAPVSGGFPDTVITTPAPIQTSPIVVPPPTSEAIECTTAPADPTTCLDTGSWLGSAGYAPGSGNCVAPTIPGPGLGGGPLVWTGNENPVDLFPDEYICDGGDAQSQVQVDNDWSLRGLDPEDTIGHFDTVDGRVVVQPSNSVCIYAPRFAATRHVVSPLESQRNLNPMAAETQQKAIGDKILEGTDQYSQNLAAERHLLIQPAAAFRHRLPGVEASQHVGLIDLTKDLPPHEDFRVLKIGVHKQAEKPMLAEFASQRPCPGRTIRRCRSFWMKPWRSLEFTPPVSEEVFSLGRKGSPKLRVVKTASVSDALPGEEVEFTLRFDNVGFQVIGNVTIVDNLTTRLEYIDDSEECTLDANFVTDENDAESLTLRWEITDPIQRGEGGTIRFRCRVR